MTLLLLACATLASVVTSESDDWVPMAPDVDDPHAGDPPCQAGWWQVTTPRGTTQVEVACVGSGPPTWEADLLPETRTAETAGEDWSISSQ